MSVTIINNYISKDDCKNVIAGLEEFLTPEPRPAMYSALGQKDSLTASKVSKDNPAIDLVGRDPQDFAIIKVSSLVNEIREEMERHYDIELDLANMNFSRITQGGENPLHSDSTKLDGSPFRDDGVPEELEYSALLYFSNYNEDFFGGEIVFPNQDIEVRPMAGTLVFFKGDVEHVHEVKKVSGGARYTLIMFYARRGNVSEFKYFED